MNCKWIFIKDGSGFHYKTECGNDKQAYFKLWFGDDNKCDFCGKEITLIEEAV